MRCPWDPAVSGSAGGETVKQGERVEGPTASVAAAAGASLRLVDPDGFGHTPPAGHSTRVTANQRLPDHRAESDALGGVATAASVIHGSATSAQSGRASYGASSADGSW